MTFFLDRSLTCISHVAVIFSLVVPDSQGELQPRSLGTRLGELRNTSLTLGVFLFIIIIFFLGGGGGGGLEGNERDKRVSTEPSESTTVDQWLLSKI